MPASQPVCPEKGLAYGLTDATADVASAGQLDSTSFRSDRMRMRETTTSPARLAHSCSWRRRIRACFLRRAGETSNALRIHLPVRPVCTKPSVMIDAFWPIDRQMLRPDSRSDTPIDEHSIWMRVCFSHGVLDVHQNLVGISQMVNPT